MKKKIALFLAAIMLIAAALPTTAFASTSAPTVTHPYTNVKGGQFMTNIDATALTTFISTATTAKGLYAAAFDAEIVRTSPTFSTVVGSSLNFANGSPFGNYVTAMFNLLARVNPNLAGTSSTDTVAADLRANLIGYDNDAALVAAAGTITTLAATNPAAALAEIAAFVAKVESVYSKYLSYINSYTVRDSVASFIKIQATSDIHVGAQFELYLNGAVWNFYNNLYEIYYANTAYPNIPNMPAMYQGLGTGYSLTKGTDGAIYLKSELGVPNLFNRSETHNATTLPYTLKFVPSWDATRVVVTIDAAPTAQPTNSSSTDWSAFNAAANNTRYDGVVYNARNASPADPVTPWEIWIPVVARATGDTGVTVDLRQTNIYGTDFTAFTGKVIAEAPGVAQVTYKERVTARDQFILDTITVKEKQAGDLIEGGYFYIAAPDGFSWNYLSPVTIHKPTTAKPILSTGEYMNFDAMGLADVEITVQNVDYGSYDSLHVDFWSGANADYEPGQVLRVQVSNFDRAINLQKYAAQFTITGLRLRADESAAWGEQNLTVFETTQVYGAELRAIGSTTRPAFTFNSEFGLGSLYTLGAINRQDYLINFKTLEDAKSLWSGRNNQVTAKVEFSENTPLSWWGYNTTEFILVDEEGNALNEKVKIVDVAMTKTVNVSNIVTTYGTQYAKPYTTSGDFRFNDNTVIVTQSKINQDKISNLNFIITVSVAANYEGGIFLKAVGRGNVGSGYSEYQQIENIKIAEAVNPIKIESKITEVQIGYQTYNVADITITEAAKNVALKTGTIELQIEAFGVVDSSGMRFIDVANVKYDFGKNGLFGKPIIAGNVISIPVLRNTTAEPFVIKLSNLKLHIDRTVPEGHYDVAVGGSAIVDNYVGAVNGVLNPYFPNQLKSMGKFTSFGVPFYDYIKVGTSGLNKALTQNVIVANGSNKAIIDGVETDFAFPAYINAANSRMYVPVRFISLALGLAAGNVIWDAKTSKVTIISSERVVEFTSGSDVYTINGAEQHMADASATIKEERMYVPFAYLAKAFNIEVGWVAETSSAYFNPSDDQKKVLGDAMVIHSVNPENYVAGSDEAE